MKIFNSLLKKNSSLSTPLLFSLSFVFSQFYAWFNEVYINSIFLPLSVVIVVVMVLFFVLGFLFRDKTKAGIFLSVFLIFFFLYSGINNLSWNILFSVGNLSFGKDVFQIFISSLILLILLLKLIKSKKDLTPVRIFLFRIGLISFAISLFMTSQKQIQRMTLPSVMSQLDLSNIQTSNVDTNKLPDIYFIEPEDYAAPSVFKNYFNYDDSEFVNYLKNKGFYVADNATSNYPKSFESLTSMLNMEYLDYLSVYKNSSDLTIINPLIDNNNVMKYLKNFGYKYYQMGSWWGPTRYNQSADANFILEGDNGHSGIDMFIYNLADSTMLSPVLDKIIPDGIIGDSDSDDRSRIIYQFSKLPQTVGLSSPKFVFAHIIAPHEPYVFGKNCEFVDKSTTSKNSEIQNYVNQTICINKNLESTIDTIIATSKKPPVIILLTDEGVPFLNDQLNPSDNWKTASDDLIKEKFPNLAAFYLPGVSKTNLYPSITSVNVFREVFNLYFDAGFPILPDKNYVFPDLNNLYEFKDVTNIVKH